MYIVQNNQLQELAAQMSTSNAAEVANSNELSRSEPMRKQFARGPREGLTNYEIISLDNAVCCDKSFAFDEQ